MPRCDGKVALRQPSAGAGCSDVKHRFRQETPQRLERYVKFLKVKVSDELCFSPCFFHCGLHEKMTVAISRLAAVPVYPVQVPPLWSVCACTCAFYMWHSIVEGMNEGSV